MVDERKVPEGYKVTEVGLIPEQWKVVALKDVAEIKTGPFGSALHAENYVEDGTPIITVEHLSDYGIIHKHLPLVSNKDKKRLSSYILNVDDLVFSRVGSVDRNSIIKSNENGWLFSGRLLRIRPNKKSIKPQYLSHHFNTTPAKQRVRTIAVGQTMPSLNTKLLSSLLVIAPPLIEQDSIAQVLSDTDNLIISLEKLIDKKKKIKQGAMQQLLNGKKRLPGFNGEWEEFQLVELLDYEQPTDYIVESTDYSVNGIPVLTPGKSFVLGYTNETSGIFSEVPVIIFDDFTTVSKFVTFPFKVKSSAMKMLKLRDKAHNLRLIFKIMQILKFTIGDHKRYWISEYSRLKINLPSIEEQNTIDQVLFDMDLEIEALEEKLEKYKNIKQGMMQELLTGRIRLI